jgi:hypothetical protein
VTIDVSARYSEAELVAGRRLWALFMIARSPEVAESILRGLPVMAHCLDAEVLRRALRGRPFPDPREYVDVTHAMLDAIDEAGPLIPPSRGKR